jgi:hypothetical protein
LTPDIEAASFDIEAFFVSFDIEVWNYDIEVLDHDIEVLDFDMEQTSISILGKYVDSDAVTRMTHSLSDLVTWQIPTRAAIQSTGNR